MLRRREEINENLAPKKYYEVDVERSTRWNGDAIYYCVIFYSH